MYFPLHILHRWGKRSAASRFQIVQRFLGFLFFGNLFSAHYTAVLLLI